MSPAHEPNSPVPAEQQTSSDAPWLDLIGQRVEVFADGRRVDQGQVEAVTRDGTILWLSAEGAAPRRIIERAPGVQICSEAHSRPE